jgi:hypothetical protein
MAGEGLLRHGARGAATAASLREAGMAYRRGQEIAGCDSMSRTKGNGPDATNDQPAKTLTKCTADFIARCGILAGQNPWAFVLVVVVALQAASLVLGVLK